MVMITALIINSAEAAGAIIISIPARINSEKTINPACSCFIVYLPSLSALYAHFLFFMGLSSLNDIIPHFALKVNTFFRKSTPFFRFLIFLFILYENS